MLADAHVAGIARGLAEDISGDGYAERSELAMDIGEETGDDRLLGRRSRLGEDGIPHPVRREAHIVEIDLVEADAISLLGDGHEIAPSGLVVRVDPVRAAGILPYRA